jgi:riboflavin biosynthesis pyrimidine reductase
MHFINKAKMERPYVICHMVSTVNGKILAGSWGDKSKAYSEQYQLCHERFQSQAWMCGRVTMEQDFTHGNQPTLIAPGEPITRKPFLAHKDATSFAIAIDAGGKLGWEENEISGDHIIEVLTEDVSDAYLYFLQQKSISYIFAGKSELDFEAALNQLANLFPIRTIMLEGGGHVNGSLLQKGLIDELSLLLLPVADATGNTPTTFELGKHYEGSAATGLRLKDIQQLEHDILWLKYQTRSDTGK